MSQAHKAEQEAAVGVRIVGWDRSTEFFERFILQQRVGRFIVLRFLTVDRYPPATPPGYSDENPQPLRKAWPRRFITTRSPEDISWCTATLGRAQLGIAEIDSLG